MTISVSNIDVEADDDTLEEGETNSGKADTYTRNQFEGMPGGWYAPGASYLDEILVPGPAEQQFIDDNPTRADEMLSFEDLTRDDESLTETTEK